MKRTIFIIIAGLLLLIVFLTWVYLLLFGAPRQVTDVFTNIGLSERATPITPEGAETLARTAELNIRDGSLVQLTTRPVAGFGFVDNGSTTTHIIYAEKGTGHVYRIDIGTGVETRVSAKTFLAAAEAVFSPDGGAVVLLAEGPTGSVASLEDLRTQRSHDFPTAADNVSFTRPGEVRYTVVEDNGGTGYRYDLETGETDVIFSSPLKDINVLWGLEETLLYNLPAPRLNGALYRITHNGLRRIGNQIQAFSVVAPKASSGIYIQTAVDGVTGNLRSMKLTENTGAREPLPIVALPDKCMFDSLRPEILWCGAPLDSLGRDAQNDWYKGLISFPDRLWSVNLNDQSAREEDNLAVVAGRDVDITGLSMDQFGSYLIFKNKIDDTLWFKNLKFGN